MVDPGREVTVPWRDTLVRAWLPDRLTGRAVELSETTVRATERAAAATRAVASHVQTGFEPLARLLLRAEGLASSHVEGIAAPLADVVLAQAGAGAGTAAHVADNLAIVDAALTHAAGNESLTAEDLHGWHRRLMQVGTLPDDLVGSWRDVVGWIGGANPLSAVFVPAPPTEIPGLMDDLLGVVDECPWDPVTTAALAHAQFETIHPYGDGNGRVGRVLALWILARHLDGVAVLPPMSVLIARDTAAYIAALGAFRIGMDDHLVAWFASVLTAAGEASITWADDLDEIVDRWEHRTEGLRSDATARRILPLLAGSPVVHAGTVADHLDVSAQAARTGLDALVKAGVLRDMGTVSDGPGRPRRWWAAPELLDLVAAWSA